MASDPARRRIPPAERWPSAAASRRQLAESEKDRRLAQLQHEIEAMRDYLRAAIEEHGAVQEELKSAHEEMLSANEEYQSTNEELETSKEELQSTNEELTTTIEELRNRNRDLGILNAETGTGAASVSSAHWHMPTPSSRQCARRSRSSMENSGSSG